MSIDAKTVIKKRRKYDQVLEGARMVFLRDGFDGANVDDIAQAAGVSKATLYSYFPDKRMLFLEVANAECIRAASAADDLMTLDAPAETVLREAAKRLVGFILTDLGLNVFRVVVGEMGRFPSIGQKYYDSGPGLVRKRLREFFELAIAKGELEIDDIALAADQFSELCRSDLHTSSVFGVRNSFTQAEFDRVVDGTVAMFMARYGTDR